jgi:hypothetical protein
MLGYQCFVEVVAQDEGEHHSRTRGLDSNREILQGPVLEHGSRAGVPLVRGLADAPVQWQVNLKAISVCTPEQLNRVGLIIRLVIAASWPC